jgi:excisionase family DNA binding protein
MPHAKLPDVPLRDRRALSLAEVAALTGFAVSTLYKWIRDGRLRTAKIAGRRIVTSAALDELLTGDCDPVMPVHRRQRKLPEVRR